MIVLSKIPDGYNMKYSFVLLSIVLLSGLLPGCKSESNPSQPNNSPQPLIQTVLVQSSAFQMGSPLGSGDVDEHPQHYVVLPSFYIGKFEVTQKQWKDVITWKQSHGGTDFTPQRGFFQGDTLPVEMVNRADIDTFLIYLRAMTGNPKWRLPTEAEWEYAARGGTHWADQFAYSGGDSVNLVAWYYVNAGNHTHNVGGKTSNQLGIFDMSGNVWEWCSDWYDPNYYGASNGTNPQGPASGTNYVIRGGSWSEYEIVAGYDCRVAYRSYAYPTFRDKSVGFRVAMGM
ncbi:MAG: formylglycine-generating enzyme family protein [Bacteroidota bacterium]